MSAKVALVEADSEDTGCCGGQPQLVNSGKIN